MEKGLEEKEAEESGLFSFDWAIASRAQNWPNRAFDPSSADFIAHLWRIPSDPSLFSFNGTVWQRRREKVF